VPGVCQWCRSVAVVAVNPVVTDRSVDLDLSSAEHAARAARPSFRAGRHHSRVLVHANGERCDGRLGANEHSGSRGAEGHEAPTSGTLNQRPSRPRPNERLSHDHTIPVERQRRRTVQLIAEVKCFTDPSAESLIVGAGENAVPGEIFRVGHAASVETGAAVAGPRAGTGRKRPHARLVDPGAADPRRPTCGEPSAAS
jgi:hypothetical protein